MPPIKLLEKPAEAVEETRQAQPMPAIWLRFVKLQCSIANVELEPAEFGPDGRPTRYHHTPTKLNFHHQPPEFCKGCLDEICFSCAYHQQIGLVQKPIPEMLADQMHDAEPGAWRPVGAPRIVS